MKSSNPKTRKLHWLMAAALPVVALAPASAMAQAASPPHLEEVVVTAQRRTQNLQQVPVAVTALSPDILSERNVSTAQDLMQVTPGLQVSTQTAGNGSGSATFFLRGMGQQRAGNGSEPAVGIYIDDIYYPALQGTVFDIVDLEQVEVLRGPQGTLFGRNTIGGAIRYTTAQPTQEFEGNVSATYGSYDRTDIQGAVNLPLGSMAALRLSGGHLQRDGYVKRAIGGSAGGTQTDLIRGQLRFTPSDTLTIDLGAQYSEDELDGFAYALPGPIVPVAGTFPFAYNLTPLGQALPYDNRFRSGCDFCQPGPGFREYNENRVTTGSATVSWDIADNLTLKSLTGATRVRSRGGIDYDGSIREIVHSFQSVSYRSFSEELQLNARLFDERLNIVAGLFFYNDEYVFADGLTIESYLNGVAAPAAPVTRQTDNIAAFVDVSFKVTDKLTLLGGLRRSEDEKEAVARNPAGAVLAARTATFASTTGRLGVQYQWTDDVMTYATVSEGFRAGGFNYVAPRMFAFEPETSRSYEAGARLDLLDGRMRLNPTVFYTRWTDIQLQSVEVTPTGNIVRLDNAGRAHTYGVELEGQWLLTENLQLFGNLATLHAEYDSVGTASGITVNSKFQRAPELTYAFGAAYTQDVFDGYEMKITVNYSWQDEQNSTPTDTDTLRLPSYGLLGARVDLTDPGDRWTLSAFVTNVADEVSYVGGVGYSKNVGANRYDLGRPREYGVSLRAAF